METEGGIFRVAKNSDFDIIKSILKRNSMLHEDISPDSTYMIVAVHKDTIIGCIGIEPHDDHGLIRSLIVRESCRGYGIGTRLVKEAISLAKINDIKELYGLAKAAYMFLERFGFAPINRITVPEAIKGTSEFKSIRLESMICIKKEI